MPGYPSIGIHADHREMVRFSSASDRGFQSVIGELQRWVEEMKRTTAVAQEPLSTSVSDHDIIGAKALAVGGIMIWGDIKQSNIVSGSQTITGDLTFGD